MTARLRHAYVGVSREKRPRHTLCSYVVERRRGRILVTCHLCGPTKRLFRPCEARILADEIRGPLGRFQTSAPRSERLQLADALDRLAFEIEGGRR